MKYWDASGIVPLLVRQARTAEMERLLAQDSSVMTWWGTPVECISAIRRLVREERLAEEDARHAEQRLDALRDGWNEVLPGDACRRTAERMLRVHPLRAAAALQVGRGAGCRGSRSESAGDGLPGSTPGRSRTQGGVPYSTCIQSKDDDQGATRSLHGHLSHRGTRRREGFRAVFAVAGTLDVPHSGVTMAQSIPDWSSACAAVARRVRCWIL